MVSVDNGSTATFTYNALGQRASKSYSGSNAVYYYHGAFGNLGMSKGGSHVIEYPLPGGFGKYYWNGSNWETDYAHKNPLGSTQLVTRADGSYAQAEIFFPFGGVRFSAGGTPDVRFASMPERDVETQTWLDPLDPTLFRMYTSGQGRWLTPDPLGGDVTNPQSLNRYAYVLNNPCSLVDPLGLQCAISVAVAGDGLTKSQLNAAEAEFKRVLGTSDIGVRFVSGNRSPDYLISFTPVPATEARPGELALGTTQPNATGEGYSNVGYVYDAGVANSMAAAGIPTSSARFGTALGDIAAHEFGHYAGNLPDTWLGIMSQVFNPLAGPGANEFYGRQVPAVQSICGRTGAPQGQGGPGPGGGGGYGWGGGGFGGGGSSIWELYWQWLMLQPTIEEVTSTIKPVT